MIRNLFSAAPLCGRLRGLAVVRIVTGLLMAYHGLEVFDRPTMEGYLHLGHLQSDACPGLHGVPRQKLLS